MIIVLLLTSFSNPLGLDLETVMTPTGVEVMEIKMISRLVGLKERKIWKPVTWRWPVSSSSHPLKLTSRLPCPSILSLKRFNASWKIWVEFNLPFSCSLLVLPSQSLWVPGSQWVLRCPPWHLTRSTSWREFSQRVSLWLSLLNGNQVHDEPLAIRRRALRGAGGFVVFPAASHSLFCSLPACSSCAWNTISATSCTQPIALTPGVTSDAVTWLPDKWGPELGRRRCFLEPGERATTGFMSRGRTES